MRRTAPDLTCFAISSAPIRRTKHDDMQVRNGRVQAGGLIECNDGIGVASVNRPSDVKTSVPIRLEDGHASA